MNEFYASSMNQNGLSSKIDSCALSPPDWQKNRKTSFGFALLLLMLLLSSGFGFAQSIANYAFATGANGSLQDLSIGSTSYLVGNLDDAAGTVQPLGFNFLFMGTSYTHFSANSNGQMRLHAGSGEAAIANNVTAAANAAILAPFTGDNEVGNGLRFKVVGTAPNRTFVLEWNQFYVFYTNLSNAGNMQVWLEESTGKITYMYGEIYNSSTSSQTRSISLASSNTTTTVGSITIGAVSTFAASATLISNTIAAGANPVGSTLIANIGSAADGSRVFFSFTPPTTVLGDVSTLSFSAITGNSSTLNWIDNATNEFGFLVTRATDAAFTQNVVNASIASTTSIGTGTLYASIQTGLSPSVNYFYKVSALVEAGQSTGISGSQSTLPPGNVTAIASGLWSEATTWLTGVVPIVTDNVIIPVGFVITQDVTAAAAFSLIVQGDLVYTVATARTLTVVNDVTISSGASIKSAATGTVTTHSLLIGGSLMNNGTIDFSTNGFTAGATITFNTPGNASFTLGTSSITNLRNASGVTLNKGTSRTNVLTFSPGGTFTVQGANALGFMVITNGLLQLEGSNSFSNPLFATNGYTISTNGGYWQNNPNATILGLGGSPTVGGLLRISSGTFNIGTSTGNSMGFSSNSLITIEGGTINAASRFGVSTSSNLINYTQTGGTINVNQIGNTSTTLASFDLGTNVASVINFTGGTVNVVLANTAVSGPRDVRGTSVFSPNFGGTGIINFGTAASAVTSSTYFISGNVPGLNISTASAFHNLSLNASAQSFGNVTVPVGSILNLNGFRFILRGTSMINNGTLTGTITGSDLYFFAGTVPQSYSGSGITTEGLISLSVDTAANTFRMDAASPGISTLRVNLFSGSVINSNKITIGTGLALPTAVQIGVATSTTVGGSFDVSPTWNLGTGTQTLIYAQESVARTSGYEVNPSRILANMVLDNTNGLTIAGGDIATMALSLTNGIVSTSSNTLVLGSATTVGTLTGGSATAYVNGALTRSIATANTNTNFVSFPIGKAGVYTPIALAPATTSIALFKAESFGSNLGTQNPSIIGLSSTRRFQALPVSGTFDNINVRISDPLIVATNILAQAPTAAGAYSAAFGSAATYAAGPPTTITSLSPISGANYTGFISYADSNACTGVPAPGNTIASSNSICLGASVTLSLQNSIAGTGVSFAWESSTDGVLFTPIADAIQSTYTVAPSEAKFYRAQVTCSGNSGASIAVQVILTNTVLSTTAGAICGLGSATLQAVGSAGTTVSWYSNMNGGAALASGSTFITPQISTTTTFYAAAEVALPVTGILGAGANTSTATAATFLPGAWGGAKTQYIIKAAELQAAGIAAGNISSLAFEPTVSGQTYQGFVVQMGSTTQSVATTAFISGLTQVYRATGTDDSYTPTANAVNTLVFGTGTGSSPTFIWDGTSNVVVSISWSRVPGASTSTASAMKVDNVGFVSSNYKQSDNATPAAMLAETTATGTGSSRPRFTINGIGICSSNRIPVVATVNTAPSFTLSDTALVLCNGQSTATPTVITAGGADYDLYEWSPSAAVTGDVLTGWNFNPTMTTTFTLIASQSSGSLCSSSATVVVTVNPVPSAVVVTPINPTVCTGAIVALSATGGNLSNTQILNENFNAVSSNWTTTNNSTGANSALIAWGLNSSPLNYSTFGSFNSNDGTQFYFSNNDAGGSGSVANTALISPMFSTLNFADASVSFWHYFRNPGDAKIEYSVNGGTSWVTIQTITATSGAPANFVQTNVILPAEALNQSNVQIRFKYDTAGWQYFWAIDNVSISGTQNYPISWSPNTNLYSDTMATVPYTGGSASTVYFKSDVLTAASMYTASVTGPFSCVSSSSISITSIDCGISYANVQFPGVASISTCASQTYYARVYKEGITEAPGQGSGMTAWIGRNSATTDPSTWNESNWQLATFNVQSGNDDEYQATFGPLATGTYYVASRFMFASGNFVYGGYSTTGGGIWNGTSNANAILNVETLAPIASSQTFCNSGTVADLVATGTSLQWFNVATDGTALSATTILSTGTYYVSQTIDGCESARATVSIVVNTTDAPTASTQTFCNAATVANLVATGEGLQWFATATSGNVLVNSAALATGNYYVSQTIDGCESTRTMVMILVNNAPVILQNPTDVSVCPNEPVTLTVEASGTNLTYQWFKNGTAITSATGAIYSISVASLSDAGDYTVMVSGSCSPSVTSLNASVSVQNTAAPTGTAIQDFTTGQTLANFTIVGQNIIWYSTATSGSVLPSSTVLVSGTVYFASQSVNGCESTMRLVVTAGADLKTPTFDSNSLRYYPNPVQSVLNVEHADGIQSVQLYNMLGQMVYNRMTKSANVTIEMSSLAAGNYVMQVTVNGITKNVKVIKK
ncbi:T9SS type A sorting domain-containing protein [Flavobacterium tegetincola]|uniref:Ig-like domain-containing protein n=1 Tax=Flavobacterium tegetincola TaxID=150172 RepID=UPI0004028567|nr:T9SS type A sorting domain-containing protein [Flavobacterium tegetincola]